MKTTLVHSYQFFSTPFTAPFVRIKAAWRKFIDTFVPVGFEDETGFHYGDGPRRNH